MLVGKIAYISCLLYLGRPSLVQRIDLDCSISDCKLLGILVVWSSPRNWTKGNRTHASRPLECHQIMSLGYLHGFELWLLPYLQEVESFTCTSIITQVKIAWTFCQVWGGSSQSSMNPFPNEVIQTENKKKVFPCQKETVVGCLSLAKSK